MEKVTINGKETVLLGFKDYKINGWECLMWCGIGHYLNKTVDCTLYFIPTIRLSYCGKRNSFWCYGLVFSWLYFYAEICGSFKNEDNMKNKEIVL